MLTTFRRRAEERRERQPLLGLFERNISQQDHPEDNLAEDDNDVQSETGGVDPEDQSEDEEQGHRNGPLLPLFQASHLDAIPVYQLTHVIRGLVESRCETTLSWDQLRSPQVSQFLVKPIQEKILRDHFTSAALYALVTNCLQFAKEATTFPGNSGSSRTRAMVCELLSIKLLKEFSARELIDALSYDFYPLQGFVHKKAVPAFSRNEWNSNGKDYDVLGVARVSTLEVAIRAQTKRFLSHPLVVQHLEAIWAGYIVFHSAADSMHRQEQRGSMTREHGLAYGTADDITLTASLLGKPSEERASVHQARRTKRTVTLYNAQYASPLKLSRLRVPRYRQFLSTCSLAILLFLFVAVLRRRSIEFRPLEFIFWLWCIGFTLDEVIGFTEQGFNLYIMSPWNVLDLGILSILICYSVLRFASFLAVGGEQHAVAGIAYDLLAMDAILLFPRLFSILDHYRYFSQLLIAFRMMVVDLLAILTLIAIACSGFFVAFALAFKSESFEGTNVAYALFQILMGKSYSQVKRMFPNW
jgi:Ion transport protein